MKKFSNIAFIVIYGIVHIDLITTVQTPFNFINAGNDRKYHKFLSFSENLDWGVADYFIVLTF